MWCGGVAGQLSWIASYPFDVVKTIIQCTTTKSLTMREVFLSHYRMYGFRYFFKGMSPTLYRSFIVNSITLPLYDYLYYRTNSVLTDRE